MEDEKRVGRETQEKDAPQDTVFLNSIRMFPMWNKDIGNLTDVQLRITPQP